MSEWQPIETAPRDGTEFLAYGSYLYPDDKAVTEYIEIVEWSGHDGWPWLSGSEMHAPGVYSHWMPLPSPPNHKTRSGDAG